MGSTFGLILAAIVMIWALVTSFGRTGDTIVVGRKSFRPARLARPGRLWGGALAALNVYVLASRMFVVIPGAHIACVYDPARRGIQNTALPEGLRVVPPWATTQQYSVQTQEYTMSLAPREGAVMGDDSIRCETNEGLKVLLDVTVLYRVDPQRAPDLWRKLGSQYAEIFVRPVIRERIRMVVAKYSVQEVYSGRRKAIEDEITAELRAPFEEEGLALEQVLLRNVAYAHKEFADAIAEKQARQQQVITEKRNLERAEFEKAATINRAKGEADSIALRANTLSQNPEVVRYEMTQKIGPRVRRAFLSQDAVALPIGGEAR